MSVKTYTVNYRYNVTDGTLKNYVISVFTFNQTNVIFCKNIQNCIISVYRYNVMLVKTQNSVISVYL